MESDILDLFSGSLEEPYTLGIYSKKQALKHMGEEIQRNRAEVYRREERRTTTPEAEAIEMLAHSLLNHVPVVNYDFSAKVMYIAHIVRRVLKTVIDPTLIDDKDYYGNKRIELPGSQISVLFEDSFKTFNSIIQTEADKELIKQNRVGAFNVINSIRRHTSLITEKLTFAISTGNWVIRRFRMDRAGITQVLSRLSYISALGMMTRVQSHYEKTRKVAGPRSLQTSQWGMICPADTPEGEACGLVKNLALLAHVTNDDDSDALHRICMDLGVVPLHTLIRLILHPRLLLLCTYIL
jgi:DNA-directed RNA polymerase III subunit RPC2